MRVNENQCARPKHPTDLTILGGSEILNSYFGAAGGIVMEGKDGHVISHLVKFLQVFAVIRLSSKPQ